MPKEKERNLDELRKQLRQLQDQMDTIREKLDNKHQDSRHSGPPPPAPPPPPPLDEHRSRRHVSKEERRRAKEARREAREIRHEVRRKAVEASKEAREVGREMSRLGKELGVMGKEMGSYIKAVIGDVMRGVDQTLRASVFVGPHGRTIRIEDNDLPDGTSLEEGSLEGKPVRAVPPEEAQQLLSPLASAERIKILYLLSEGAMYHQDLMRESGLAPGTLPHHLKQLEEAGYVTQERVRGRYLITIPGRMALKLVEYLYFQMNTGFEFERDEEEE